MTNFRRVPRPKMLGGEVTWLNPGGIEYEETWYTMNLIYSVAGICGFLGIVFIVMTTKVLCDMGFFGDRTERYLRRLMKGQRRFGAQGTAFAEAQEKRLRKLRGYPALPPYHEPPNAAHSRRPLPDSSPPGSNPSGRDRRQKKTPPPGYRADLYPPPPGLPKHAPQSGRGNTKVYPIT